MTAQELYDMSPDDIQSLDTDAAVARDAILMEYMRDVGVGYEPPLRQPDAYPRDFLVGLPIAQIEHLIHLQATRGRAAVLAARREMADQQPKPAVRLPTPYPVGMPGDSYGPQMFIADDPPWWSWR
jgi:hypothetical protein